MTYSIRVGVISPSDRIDYTAEQLHALLDQWLRNIQTYFVRETGHTFDYDLRVWVSRYTHAELAGPNGINQWGDGLAGNKAWDEWILTAREQGTTWENETPGHPRTYRHVLFVVGGGGYAAGAFGQTAHDAAHGYIRVGDQWLKIGTTEPYTGPMAELILDEDYGESMLGDWGLHAALTGEGAPGCLAFYPASFCTQPPEGTTLHEMLHMFGVDSHDPTILSTTTHLSAYQKSSFLLHNEQFLRAVDAPPVEEPPPPPPVEEPPAPRPPKKPKRGRGWRNLFGIIGR